MKKVYKRILKCLQKAEKFDKITQVAEHKISEILGIRQAVRQRTLTPSFGCSNHLSPAKKNGMHFGIPFFCCIMQMRSDSRVGAANGSERFALRGRNKKGLVKQNGQLKIVQRGALLKARITYPQPQKKHAKRCAFFVAVGRAQELLR